MLITRIIMLFISFIFFRILFFPVFYDYLFSLSPEINRYATSQCFFELFHIVTSDILLTSGYEVSFYYVRKCFDKDIKRLLIFSAMSFFMWLDRILQCMNHIRGLPRTSQNQRFTPHKLHHNIRNTENRIDP